MWAERVTADIIFRVCLWSSNTSAVEHCTELLYQIDCRTLTLPSASDWFVRQVARS